MKATRELSSREIIILGMGGEFKTKSTYGIQQWEGSDQNLGLLVVVAVIVVVILIHELKDYSVLFQEL